MDLNANIELPTDVKGCVDNGADGVGLFRSEFLFMHREDLPTEDEQFGSLSRCGRRCGRAAGDDSHLRSRRRQTDAGPRVIAERKPGARPARHPAVPRRACCS